MNGSPGENAHRLRARIVDRGLCTGCGTCVGICPAGCLQFDSEAEEPVQVAECLSCGLCLAVCPGEEVPLRELEAVFLGSQRKTPDDFIGVFRRVVKGCATDAELRRRSASGGMTTAILLHALETGKIDGAVVTGMDIQKPWRVRPFIARTPVEIVQAAKSKYGREIIIPNAVRLNTFFGFSTTAAGCAAIGRRRCPTCRWATFLSSARRQLAEGAELEQRDRPHPHGGEASRRSRERRMRHRISAGRECPLRKHRLRS